MQVCKAYFDPSLHKLYSAILNSQWSHISQQMVLIFPIAAAGTNSTYATKIKIVIIFVAYVEFVPATKIKKIYTFC